MVNNPDYSSEGDESQDGESAASIDLDDDTDLQDDLPDDTHLESVDFSKPWKNILSALNSVLCHRLNTLDCKVDALDDLCATLEHKIDGISSSLRDAKSETDSKVGDKTVIVSLPQIHLQALTSDDELPGRPRRLSTTGSNIQLFTLNTEADYPNGSWLGDETNPEMRVRCCLSPTDLFHINMTCHTAEKMALTLLDYLFDRETQACSNISGTGKHKKKQLDPLMIYGVKCHLIRSFAVSEKDWQRIKRNLDSKCRTAYRRKIKGMPLIVKAFSHKASTADVAEGTDLTSQVVTLHPTVSLADQADFASMVNSSQIIHTPDGDIQLVHATPEQLAQIQQVHQIQILSGDQIISSDGIIQQVNSEMLYEPNAVIEGERNMAEVIISESNNNQ